MTGDTDIGGSYACFGAGSIKKKKSLYFPLSFAIKLKLLLKVTTTKRKRIHQKHDIKKLFDF